MLGLLGGGISATGLSSSTVSYGAEMANSSALDESGAMSSTAYHYAKGDLLSTDIFVADKDGSKISLASLLGTDDASNLNVLFLFGGGDLGSGEPGHLWCQDSFEDTHILRTLVGKYRGYGVNFIAVASAPVYHSQVLGFPEGVFLNAKSDSKAFKSAQKAFVASTMAAFDDGILPIEPYFDTRFRLMLNRTPQLLPGPGYGEITPWQGAFRLEGESQFYGVPNFWIISNSGEILTEPFRGNIYHPRGGEVNISYSLADLDKLLKTHL